MRYRALPLIVTLALAVLFALTATALAQDTTTTEPAPPPVGIAPSGSTVAGVDISNQDAATALVTVDNAFAQPIVILIGDRTFKVTSAQVGAVYGVQAAVTEATARTAAGNTPVTTTYNETKLQNAVDRVLRLASTKGQEAKWTFTRTKPILKLGKPGSAPNRAVVESQIRQAISLPLLRAVQPAIPLAPVNTEATLAKLGYVVVVSKPSRSLALYAPVKGKAKVVRHYRVAVGAPSFPTPSGRFTIVTKQKNPWWYPPTYASWAQGSEPVPPGPSNPLGTRWMGLDREDVGIHGTPDSGSIGGYASHGCVRMLISQAEALFNLIDIGTPVVIY